MALGICKLCGEERELRLSHLFPKFIFRWMQNTGGQYLRQVTNPNLRRQDGPKKHLLCGKCEQRFSTREDYFSRNVFYPYIDRRQMAFDYDERLIYFLVSVLWRVLADKLDWYEQQNFNFSKELRKAERVWREYLLGEKPLAEYGDIHLFITDVADPGGTQPVEGFNSYMARSIDATAASNENECAVYAKFARFLIFGMLTPYDDTQWVNTKVENGRGTLTIPQQLLNPAVGEFLLDRARSSKVLFNRNVSGRQREVINRAVRENFSKVINTDLGRIMDADFSAEVDPTMYRKKIGRNEKCPCGSDKKFKKCHGAVDRNAT
jgi:SEC-C motif